MRQEGSTALWARFRLRKNISELRRGCCLPSMHSIYACWWRRKLDCSLAEPEPLIDALTRPTCMTSEWNYQRTDIQRLLERGRGASSALTTGSSDTIIIIIIMTKAAAIRCTDHPPATSAPVPLSISPLFIAFSPLPPVILILYDYLIIDSCPISTQSAMPHL